MKEALDQFALCELYNKKNIINFSSSYLVNEHAGLVAAGCSTPKRIGNCAEKQIITHQAICKTLDG